MQGLVPEAYAAFAQRIFASLGQVSAVTTPADVAQAVWRALLRRLTACGQAVGACATVATHAPAVIVEGA